MRSNFKTPSHSSPRGGSRGCLCPNGTYSRKCCDGSLQAQGIGPITALPYYKKTWDTIDREWVDMNSVWES